MWEHTGAYLWNCFFSRTAFFLLSLFANIVHCPCKCPNENSAVGKNDERTLFFFFTRTGQDEGKGQTRTQNAVYKKKKVKYTNKKGIFFSLQKW